MFHPRRRENGEKVWLKQPSTASPATAWQYADQIAVAVPGSPLPEIINDVAVKPWREAPKGSAGWESLAETMVLHEPAFDVPAGLKPAAGVVLFEPDGRIWIVAPSNRFGGYSATFPKGRLDGKSLKATAICEAFEESGLQVTLTNFLIDVPRTTTWTRYYLGRRLGGSPAHMGWESQAVMLVPPQQLPALVTAAADAAVLKKITTIIR